VPVSSAPTQCTLTTEDDLHTMKTETQAESPTGKPAQIAQRREFLRRISRVLEKTRQEG